MIDYKYYGLRHDVWGMGILMFMLLGGEFPFDGENEVEIMDKIKTKKPNWSLLEQANIHKEIIDVVKGMLHKDPSKRLTIKQVVASNPFSLMIKKMNSKVNY